jgi:hypothetical protein
MNSHAHVLQNLNISGSRLDILTLAYLGNIILYLYNIVNMCSAQKTLC